MSLSKSANRDTDIDTALLAFAVEIASHGLLEGLKTNAVALYKLLKPKLIDIYYGKLPVGKVASVVKDAGKLFLYVVKQPVFWVFLAGGVSVMVQLGLESCGHSTLGKAAGAAGITATGGLAGALYAGAVLAPPVAVGAFGGLLAWNAVNFLREYALEVRAKEYLKNN